MCVWLKGEDGVLSREIGVVRHAPRTTADGCEPLYFYLTQWQLQHHRRREALAAFHHGFLRIELLPT